MQHRIRQLVGRCRRDRRFWQCGLFGLASLSAVQLGQAATVSFTLDPVASTISVDADLQGTPLVPQVSGNSDGDVTTYSGEIIVEVDDPSNPTSIKFLGGTAVAANSGNWLPAVDGGDVGDPDIDGDANPGDAAPGNYGLYLDLSVLQAGEAWGAFRDLVWTMQSESSIPIVNHQFAGDPIAVGALQGSWTTSVSSPLLHDSAGVDDITGALAMNEAATGSYTVSGNVARLELPLSLFFPASPNFAFTGKLIGTLSLTQHVDGDFNGDSALTAADINLLTTAVNSGENAAEYDLTADGIVDEADRTKWVEELRHTYFGDSDMNGIFDTDDLITVFVAGQYEDEVAGNSLWENGDWDGNTEFESADFVFALQHGGYEEGPRAAVAAVPEPASVTLLSLALLGAAQYRRASRRAN